MPTPGNSQPVPLRYCSTLLRPRLPGSEKRKSTNTMTATPPRCHQTLTSPRTLTRLTPKVLSRPWTTSTNRYVMKIDQRLISMVGLVALPKMLMLSRMKFASAKSTEAITPICPIRLNQPVHQAQSAFRRRAKVADQKYKPPAVG